MAVAVSGWKGEVAEQMANNYGDYGIPSNHSSWGKNSADGLNDYTGDLPGSSGRAAAAAYSAWMDSDDTTSDRVITEAYFDNFCSAEAFYKGLHYWKNTRINEAMVEWLMEDCPQWWIDVLSEDQRASRMGKGWSADRRYKYEYPISRLEYWASMWTSGTDNGEPGLQYYMHIHCVKRDNKGDMTDTTWNEHLRDYNRKEWEHALKIIQLVWGYYQTKGGSKKWGTGNVRYNLYQKTSNYTNAERKFIEMLSINQGKGPAFLDLWGPNNIGESDYPWAVDEDGVPIHQYIYVGSGEKDDNGNVIPPSDPVTHGILYKMLYTEDGYTRPFDPDNMGYMEKVAMADRVRNDEGRLTGEVSFTTAKRYLTRFTAETFLEKVMGYLQSPDDQQIWDGVLRSGRGNVNKKTLNIRRGGEMSIYNGIIGPGGNVKGSNHWVSRDQDKDNPGEVSWDTGLFYWQDSDDDQFDASRGGASFPSDERAPWAMGAGAFQRFLLPQQNYGTDWLKPDGDSSKHGNNGLWVEHHGFVRSLIRPDQGYMADYGNGQKFFDTTPNKKYKILLHRICDSGFVDWEGLISGEDKTYVSSLGKGNTKQTVLNAHKEAALTFVPDKVTINNKQFDTEGFVLDFVRDVNKLKPGTLKGRGLDFETVVDNEKAKQLCAGIKDLFLKFAGSEAHGHGPETDQATAKWFTDNFTNNIVPTGFADGKKSFSAVLNIGDVEDPAAQDALNALLGGGYDLDSEDIRFDKNTLPYMAPYLKKVIDIPFDQILRTYQASAYMAALYYRFARKNVDNVNLLVNDIWDHFAFKCAFHFYRIWDHLLHDHQVGNLYALLCVVMAETDFQSEDALKALEALAGLLGAADDDIMKQIAEADAPPQVEDTSDPAANKEQRERFYKQCALLLNMDKLQFKYTYDGEMHKMSKQLGFTSYNGRIHMVTDNGSTNGQKNTMLNKMISPNPEVMRAFTEITPAKASELQPYIRFFRVWHENGGLKEQEFTFPKTVERDSQGKIRIERDDPFDRGDGMGLTEFTWECDGETPATASKYINATATFHFQTFNDFIRERRNQNGDTYRWVDMFVSPTNVVARGGPTANTPHTLKYDSEYYRIRVDVGYHTDSTMAEALATQNRSFFLVLIDNEININDDMSVDISANYRAYIEEAMDSNKFNALSTPELRVKEEEMKKDWDAATKSWKEGGCSDNDLRSVRNQINIMMEDIIKKQHKSIMKNMLDLERIYYVDFKPSHIAAFRQSGVFEKIPEYSKSNSHKLKPEDGAAARLKKLMEAKDDPNRDAWMEHSDPHKDERVYYFYLGDLIYLINSSMYKGMRPWISAGPIEDSQGNRDRYRSGAENHKILLMDFDYHNTLAETANSRRTINIAHIPISVDFFFQWYVNNIIKNETYHIGVGNFIKKMLTELITEAMSEICMSSEEGHYVTFQHGSISVAGTGIDGPGGAPRQFIDPITSMLLTKKDTSSGMIFDVSQFYATSGMGDMSLPFRSIPDQEVLEEFDLNGVQGQFQYVYIYGDTKDAMHAGRGDENLDAKRGCYHLHLGSNSGLVKNISFSKNNVPYLRESRMFNQGQAGLLQLSAVYDCEINMIGNTLFLPGQEVWVNPYGFGGDAFGKPQDPPLNWSPTSEEVNAVNDSIRKKKESGNTLDKDEMVEIVEQVDNLQQVVDERTERLKMKILSYANVMGIGGYQLIIRTKCTIKPGEFSTTITAKHTYTGYPTIKNSLNLAEFREAKPKKIGQANDAPDDACRAIEENWDDKPI